MMSLLGKLSSLGQWLIGLGPLGVFGISLLDSAFVPLPGGPDLAVIVLSARNHELMPLIALAAALGSTIGCTVLYTIARRAGDVALRGMGAARRKRIEHLLGRYDLLAVAIPSVMPPPFPFKPFVLCAGVFEFKMVRFVAALLVGRIARFLIEGALAVRYGEEAAPLIRRHGIAVLIAVGLIFLFALAFFGYRRRHRQTVISESQPPA
jgi:membrane protein YqaA with SNARE-associated domain